MTDINKPCETCNDDPVECSKVLGLRHCEKANREKSYMTETERVIRRLQERAEWTSVGTLFPDSESTKVYTDAIDEIVRLDTECLNQEIIIEELRKEIENLKAYVKHERDLGAEDVAEKDTEIIQSLIEALKDAQHLIDNDLIGPWMSAHKLDKILK